MLRVIERLSRNPVVVAAIVAAFATFVASRIASQSAEAQSRIASQSAEEQLEGNLIIEAVKVCDKHQATNNLRFLMAAGFLKNHYLELQTAIDGGLEKVVPPRQLPRSEFKLASTTD
jgi:hypothetical protein